MAMKQKLRAFCGQYAAQVLGIDETPKETPRRAERRVMDQHDAETSKRFFERLGKPRELSLAKPSGRQERTGRNAGRKRNQGHLAPAADKRKPLEPVIAAHVIAPKF